MSDLSQIAMFSSKVCRDISSHDVPGGDVTIAGAGHGDDGPVQSLRQGEEHRVRLILKIRNAQDILSQLMQTFSRA